MLDFLWINVMFRSPLNTAIKLLRLRRAVKLEALACFPTSYLGILKKNLFQRTDAPASASPPLLAAARNLRLLSRNRKSAEYSILNLVSNTRQRKKEKKGETLREPPKKTRSCSSQHSPRTPGDLRNFHHEQQTCSGSHLHKNSGNPADDH